MKCGLTTSAVQPGVDSPFRSQPIVELVARREIASLRQIVGGGGNHRSDVFGLRRVFRHRGGRRHGNAGLCGRPGCGRFLTRRSGLFHHRGLASELAAAALDLARVRLEGEGSGVNSIDSSSSLISNWHLFRKQARNVPARPFMLRRGCDREMSGNRDETRRRRRWKRRRQRRPGKSGARSTAGRTSIVRPANAINADQ
jgi:hypothetical protein